MRFRENYFVHGAGLYSRPVHLPQRRHDSPGHATIAGAPLSTPAVALFGAAFAEWLAAMPISCAP